LILSWQQIQCKFMSILCFVSTQLTIQIDDLTANILSSFTNVSQFENRRQQTLKAFAKVLMLKKNLTLIDKKNVLVSSFSESLRKKLWFLCTKMILNFYDLSWFLIYDGNRSENANEITFDVLDRQFIKIRIEWKLKWVSHMTRLSVWTA